MAAAGGRNQGADFPQQPPRPPEDVELKNIIDKLANFVARNGPEFEQMTMNKQRDNPKFQFLFGGEWQAYYKWRVSSEQQGGYQPRSAHHAGGGSHIPPLIRPLMSVGNYPMPPNMLPPFPPAPLFRGGPPPPGYPPGGFPPQNFPPIPLLPASSSTPSSSSSATNKAPWQQPQTQAPPLTTQATPTGSTYQLQLVRQELQKEIEKYGVSDPMEVEFGSVMKRVMESCTKDAISVGKSWIFSHAQQPNDCAKVAKFLLRKTLDGPGVGYPEKLHIIYLINDVLHQCARKGAQDLLQGIEDLVVQMIYNVYCSTSSDNTENLVKVVRIWEGQNFFTEPILKQIQSVISGGGGVEQTEEEKIRRGDGDQRKPWSEAANQPPPNWEQKPRPPWEGQALPDNQKQPPWQPPQDQKPPPPPPWQGDGPPSQSGKPPMLPWQQQSQQPHPWEKQPETSNPPMLPWQQPRGPPSWPPHPEGPHPIPPWGGPRGAPPPPWGQQGPLPVGEPTPLFPTSKPGDHHSSSPAPPSSQTSSSQESQLSERREGHDGMEPSQRREGEGLITDGPHSNVVQPRPDSSPNRELHPHPDDDRGPPDAAPRRGPVETYDYQHGHQFGHGFGENFHKDGPPPPPPPSREVFDYNHTRPPHWDMPPHPPPHHLPPPPPPMGPNVQFDSWGPPPPPHLAPPPPPPDLPPAIPYFDLPAGLMVAVVPLFEHSFRSLNPRDIRLPPPQPPSERLLQAVDEFYKPVSDDKPRNEEGWEAKALLDFYEAKQRAKNSSRYRPMRRQPPRRQRSRSRSRSYSRSPPPRRRRSRSYSRSRSRSRSRSKSPSRSPPRRRMYSDDRGRSRSRSRSISPSHHSRQRRSRSRSPFIPIAEERPLPPPSVQSNPETKLGDGNVGHQLLKKMGWEEGAGLGAREQGIQEPIKGGEVRDKNDKYKGVGMDMKDPFELFRKNKSYTFNRSTRAPPSPP